MRIFHVDGDQFAELPELPDQAPSSGYVWVGVSRSEFEKSHPSVQAALQRWTGGQLVDLHVSDLLNAQLPSNFDYTSIYDLLVFRRLAAVPDGSKTTQIDTSPVGFAVFDRVLLTVHPQDCQVREFFAARLEQQQQTSIGSDLRGGTRVPPNPADLALRMVNFIVDSYLELRRRLTKELDEMQRDLFAASGGYLAWQTVLEARNQLHVLEDTCEDQRAAITEWIDAQEELPPAPDPATARERELLRVRTRDVQEHIERVLSHVRRLESMADNAVQMHFSAQGHRTNEIMRTLTVLTAIFLPLNLLTGFFGMNFEGLPLIHSARGFWVIFSVMLAIGLGLSWYFWRARYLTRER